MKILPIALLSLAFAFGISAQPTLTITEQNETLTADYNGTAVPLTLHGPVDGWTVPAACRIARARVEHPDGRGERGTVSGRGRARAEIMIAAIDAGRRPLA